jgi:hypothetical protein
MNTDTPETDEALSTAECESDLVIRMRRMERERDEWKAKFLQQNKDLGCELRDPNGTIWDHAKTLQRERDEARAESIRWMSIAEGRGHADDEDELAVVVKQRDRLAEALRLIADGTSCRECGGEDQALFARQAIQSMICDALQSLTPNAEL